MKIFGTKHMSTKLTMRNVKTEMGKRNLDIGYRKSECLNVF